MNFRAISNPSTLTQRHTIKGFLESLTVFVCRRNHIRHSQRSHFPSAVLSFSPLSRFSELNSVKKKNWLFRFKTMGLRGYLSKRVCSLAVFGFFCPSQLCFLFVSWFPSSSGLKPRWNKELLSLDFDGTKMPSFIFYRSLRGVFIYSYVMVSQVRSPSSLLNL